MLIQCRHCVQKVLCDQGVCEFYSTKNEVKFPFSSKDLWDQKFLPSRDKVKIEMSAKARAGRLSVPSRHNPPSLTVARLWAFQVDQVWNVAILGEHHFGATDATIPNTVLVLLSLNYPATIPRADRILYSLNYPSTD